MTYLIIFLIAVAAYLLGSIPGGYLLTKLVRNEDIRDHGSKSTGATNATRLLGWKLGLVAALIDVLKGIVVIAILEIFQLTEFYLIGSVNILPFYGIIAVLGHVFSIYLKFRGGKAVATSFGVVTYFTPPIAFIGIIIFVLIIHFTKYVSLGSMITAAFLFIVATVVHLIEPSLVSLEEVITYFILVVIIILRHIPNIKRLSNNEELKFKIKKQEWLL